MRARMSEGIVAVRHSEGVLKRTPELEARTFRVDDSFNRLSWVRPG